MSKIILSNQSINPYSDDEDICHSDSGSIEGDSSYTPRHWTQVIHVEMFEMI